MVSCQQKVNPQATATLQFRDAQKVWRLYSVNGNILDNGLQERQIPFLIFSLTDKRISGSGGCNRFSASFSLEEKKGIKIGPLASTRMACENLSLENDFFYLLGKTDTYDINKLELTLYSEQAKGSEKFILVFHPAINSRSKE